MKKLLLASLALFLFSGFYFSTKYTVNDTKFISHVVNPLQNKLHFYWQDNQKTNFRNFKTLKEKLATKGEKLTFAMNGGMYLKDGTPQGLYIENGEVLTKMDTTDDAYGNFYLQPNGVFYISNKNKAIVCRSTDLTSYTPIQYATQSGPMLLTDGKVHPKFNQVSPNLHIRNGVGILPNGDVLFVLSKEEVNFYDLATYFKQNGCKNALYLDGFVSRMFLPRYKNGYEMMGILG